VAQRVYKVELTIKEAQYAAERGSARRIESIWSRRANQWGFPNPIGWGRDIEAAAAEAAFCKFRGVPFTGVINNFKGPDVGTRGQVRHTDRDGKDDRPPGRLIIKPNDNPDHYYVLVWGHVPNFEIVGWIKGRDGQQRQYWSKGDDRGYTYMVPQAALHDMAELTDSMLGLGECVAKVTETVTPATPAEIREIRKRRERPDLPPLLKFNKEDYNWDDGDPA